MRRYNHIIPMEYEVNEPAMKAVPTYGGLPFFGEASGAIASFVTDIPYRLKKLLVDIDAVQDLHGYDAPWVGGAGKNKCDAQNPIVLSQAGNIGAQPCVIPAGTYTYSWTSSESIAIALSIWKNGTNMQVFNSPSSIQGRGSLTFTIDFDADEIRCYFNGATTVSDIQVEAGSTATAFAPYSNICPISGWTGAKVSVNGVNQWDEEWEVGTINGQGQNTSANDRIRSKNYIPCLPNTTYYTSNNSTYLTAQVFFYDIGKNYITNVYSSDTHGLITTPSNAYFMRFRTFATYGTTYNHDISINYPSTDTSYHAYNGKTYATGVNVWDEEWELGAYNSAGNKASQNDIIRCKNHIPILPNKDFYFYVKNYTAYARVCYYDSTDTFVSYTDTLVNKVITPPATAYYMAFNLQSAYGTTYNHDISINFPSTITEYRPYAGATATQNYMDSFGKTVYGGVLNVMTGLLTINKFLYIFDGTENFFNKSSTALNGFYCNMQGSSLPHDWPKMANYGGGAIALTDEKASMLKIGTVVDYRTKYGYCYFDSGQNFSVPPETFGTTVTSFKQKLAELYQNGTPFSVFCKIATPQTYQLTPEEVKALCGQNNIWADTGDVDVEYFLVAEPAPVLLTSPAPSLNMGRPTLDSPFLDLHALEPQSEDTEEEITEEEPIEEEPEEVTEDEGLGN